MFDKQRFTLSPENFRLTTAEIFYHMPDPPHLLQVFIWQEYDYAPDFPYLHSFLTFWEKNLEGRLHSVTVTEAIPVEGSDWDNVDSVWRIN